MDDLKYSKKKNRKAGEKFVQIVSKALRLDSRVALCLSPHSDNTP